MRMWTLSRVKSHVSMWARTTAFMSWASSPNSDGRARSANLALTDCMAASILAFSRLGTRPNLTAIQKQKNIIKKWHQNDTKMTPKWHQNNFEMPSKWHKNDTKMTQKWHKNDTKMTRKWHLDLIRNGGRLEFALEWATGHWCTRADSFSIDLSFN